MRIIRSWLKLDVTITVLAFCMVIYHILSVFYLFVEPYEHQNIHLSFALALVFLSAIEKNKKSLILKLLFVFLSLGATGYIAIFYNNIQDRLGFPTPADVIIGVIFIILCMEGTRKAYGPILPVLVLCYIFYALFGYIFPEPFQTIYYPITKIIGKLTILQGIYGLVLGISANFIFLFILFGAVLQISGATEFFVQIGRFIGRRFRSGAALSAVVTSCLLGTSNSGVSANIIITGSFTIPMMKKIGYKPYQAAAIEATASTGGQLMPPVMGATAFIMSAMTGISYIEICIAATIPALLYYLSAGLYVHFQAGKLNLSYIQEEFDRRELLLSAPLFLIPLAILIVLMVIGYTPTFAVTWALFILLGLSLVRKKTRPSFRQWIQGITRGAITGAEIGVVCALVGAIVATSSMTGLVIKLPAAIEAWSGGILPVALGITAGVSIILGCGVTVAATYILVAMMSAPALTQMGLTVLQAHFFVFYFAVISFVTPPVALGSLFAARIANSKFFPTAIESAKVALAGFIVPFLIILQPALIFEAPVTASLIFYLIAVLLILTALQIVVCSYYITTISSTERILFFLVAAVLFLFMGIKSYMLFVSAIILFALLTLGQLKKSRL